MLTTVVERIDSFNAAHPWSHNDFYHRWILRQLPDHVPQSLDVGCGTVSTPQSRRLRSCTTSHCLPH